MGKGCVEQQGSCSSPDPTWGWSLQTELLLVRGPARCSMSPLETAKAAAKVREKGGGGRQQGGRHGGGKWQVRDKWYRTDCFPCHYFTCGSGERDKFKRTLQ